MSDKGKKSGNGHDKSEAGKILSFPPPAARTRQRREREAQSRQSQTEAARLARQARQSAARVPFFNFGLVPPFTRVLIAVFIAVFVPLEIWPVELRKADMFMMLGLVPAYFSGGLENMPWYAPLGLLSHVLLHGHVMHLIFNTVMTLIFGVLVENILGTRRMVIMFFLCALAGALLHVAFNPFSVIPMVGASGAISGLFGASLLILYEQGRMGPVGARGPWPMIWIWVALMAVVGVLTPGAVAWQAHIGGFLAGVGLYHFLRRGKIRF